MLFRFVIFIIAFVVMTQANTSGDDFLSDDFIKVINKLNSTWKAGRNFDKDIDFKYIKSLMGVRLRHRPDHYKRRKMTRLISTIYGEIIDLPDEFDSRFEWPYCPTIGEISDQGGCGSSWAFGAVDVMSDRVCIHSKGTKIVRLSANHLLTCCPLYNSGCNGGDAYHAWYYWVENGIVSGGSYESNQGCQPYEIPTCDHFNNPNSSKPLCHWLTDTPRCRNKCQSSYETSFMDDLHYGKKSYYIDSGDERIIREEIFKNGPVEAIFNVYDDFLSYKSGIYQYVEGFFLGSHGVKILGWGVSLKTLTPYWLVANSWGTGWGDRGYFKIKRGVNECGIESAILAGIPELKKKSHS